MVLSDYVTTLGTVLRARYGERVHKVSIDASFTCPNRDGSKGQGGCTFCNNSSFSPNGCQPAPIANQISAGQSVVSKRMGAHKYLAYFQAYTNTYGDFRRLKIQYDQALAEPNVIGLSVGTRPDCVSADVLDLLADYQAQGKEIWLELGLQSSFDHSLERINRGHGYAEYRDTLHAARQRGLQVCTHLIVGLPGEDGEHSRTSLSRVLDEGVDGLKLHALHVVKGTQLANEWRRGEYQPWRMEQYIDTVVDLIEMTPPEVVYHRLTGTASSSILLAPEWCGVKWRVLNGIVTELVRRGSRQGSALVDST